MTRKRTTTLPPPPMAAAPGGWAPPAAAAPDPDTFVVYDPDAPPYETRPQRPFVQRLLRVGLWTAVGAGCLGGILGVVTRPPTQVREVTERGPGDEVLPAPVAGVAELAVEAWLTAERADDARLRELYVEPVTIQRTSGRSLAVAGATTVAGERLADGFWSVTLAIDVTEVLPAGAGSGAGATPTAPASPAPPATPGPPADAEQEELATTWYVEVAIVGDEGGGLAALTTPTVLPGLPHVEDGWRSTGSESREPPADDPLRDTVAGFLSALLAGDGDPARYVAPGSEIRAADPLPFVRFELGDTPVDDLGAGRVRVLAHGVGTTPGGFGTPVVYEMALAQREGRWEIVEFTGAPTMAIAPPAPAAGAEASPPG